MNPIQYPLTIEFKKIALTNKMTVKDANGNVVVYAHQKLMKLKEQILLFADKDKTISIGELRADKVIDFSPTLTYTNANGLAAVSIKRNGRRSILKADYDIIDPNGNPLLKVREGNAWVKVLDALSREVPILGMFSGYFFNPTYNVTTADETQILATIKKQPSFFETSYSVELTAQLPPAEGLEIAFLSVILRERYRG